MSHPLSALILILAVILSSGSQAAAQLGQSSPSYVVITAAAADDTFIQIQGVNFGSSPVVFLGGIPLGGVTVSNNGTHITALNPAFPSGTYLLHVSTGNGASQNGTFNLTIGAAGPPGPAGADGVDGKDGIDGKDGLDGKDGADGKDGKDGAPGPQGPPGPPGPPLISLNALAGLPCSVGTQSGTVTVATAADGTISFRCVATPPDPETDADYLPFSSKAAYFTAFTAFEFPQQVSLPIDRSCFGDVNSTFGTGACLAASAAGVSLTTDGVDLSEPDGPTPLDQLGSFTARWRFDVSSAPLAVQYKLLGVPGSCTLAVQGVDLYLDVKFEFDRLDAARDEIRLQALLNPLASLDFNGCSDVAQAGLMTDILASIQGQIAFGALESLTTPACRSRDSTAFQACPAP